MSNNITMTASKVDLSLIQKTELFLNLAQNEIDFIVSRAGLLNLTKGKQLFTSGEKARHLKKKKKGTIRVFKPHDDGSEDEMAMFTTGDTIGDFDFARGAEYDAIAEASEDSELITFPAMELTMNSLAQEKPRVVCNILLNAIVMMTGRIKSVNKLILDNMSWVQQLHRRAYEDSSTGLWKQALINDEIINVLSEPAALIMLKPDRFKILVDSRGHSAGDEAMVRIAIILKNITRKVGHGWSLRLRSNEVALIFDNIDEEQANEIAKELFDAIIAMEPVPAQDENPEFHFSATVSWAIWAKDDPEWLSFYSGTYAALMDAWRDGGEKIVRYTKTVNK
jgi:diguanylate cyclase (GGDEF)-like protein